MENSPFIVSARKYRPSTFSTVVGQKNLTATLKNAIATDRLAHAYLFCGSRGVGKTSCARIFAKTINCEHPTPDGDPCNECQSCRSFNEGRSLNIIELDAASNNGVDDIRSLNEQVLVPPTNGKYRVFIIDEVHMLSPQAFNAFLKTLEEPPGYVIFILATTEKQKIIPTILSRCQIYDFNRITITDIVEHLEYVARSEGYETERDALTVIASKSDGALRDALSIFDQVAASSRGKVTYKSTIENLNVLDDDYFNRLAEYFLISDVAGALLLFKEIRDKGFDVHFFINGLQAYIRSLMVARDSRTLPLLDTTDEQKKRLSDISQKFSPDFFYMALSLINDADLKYREASNKNFLAELLLIKLCQLLSPSPVFRGKEEGHLDNLAPLEPVPQVSRPVIPSEQPAGSSVAVDVAASQSCHESVMIKESEPIPYNTFRPQRDKAKRPGPMPKVKSIRSSIPSEEGSKEKDLSNAQTPDRVDSRNRKEFSLNDLTVALKEYSETIQEKKILANTLLSSSLTIENTGEKTDISFTVFNPIQKQLLADEHAVLMKFLKEKLMNDFIELTVNIEESRELPASAWSEREVLDHMIAAHPQMGEFVKALNLRLS